MVEAELHFFQVEIEVFATDSIVTFQLSLGIAPEVLDAVDMLPLAHRKALLVIDAVVLEAVKHQPVIRAEAVGVDHAHGYHFRPDNLPQRLARDIFHDPGIDLAAALQEPENGDFASRAAAARAFAATAEVALIGFDLAAERAMGLALTGQTAADDLVDALGAVAVDAHHFRYAARGHFQGEVLDELVELAVRQLTVFNQSLRHSNSLFLDSCSRQAPFFYLRIEENAWHSVLDSP